MIELDNRTEENIDIALLEPIAMKMADKDIELILTDNREMRELNKKYRNIDKATDVLSFPIDDIPHSPLGSIIISMDKAKEEALRLGHTIENEIALLFIHGLLHLVGYDHESDGGEMRKMEKELIDEFGLPKSLIIRIEE